MWISMRDKRIVKISGVGSFCRFDPLTELVSITRIPPLDSEVASEMYVDEVLDGEGVPSYLDKVE